MDTILADLRQGLRPLRKSPAGTLTLGIGANSAMCSIVERSARDRRGFGGRLGCDEGDEQSAVWGRRHRSVGDV
jgi:hypothetical protein